VASDEYTEEYAGSADEVADGVARMKANKNDGYAGLSTNHFKLACIELFTHLSFFRHACVRQCTGCIPPSK